MGAWTNLNIFCYEELKIEVLKILSKMQWKNVVLNDFYAEYLESLLKTDSMPIIWAYLLISRYN